MDRIEANRALGRKFFEEQDRRKGPVDPTLCGPSYQAQVNNNPPMDREGHDGFGRAFYAAFPDLHHEIADIVAEPERVAVRFILQGTQRQPFFGIPATQKAISVPATVIMHLRDGRVTQLLGVFDEAGMLRQLGVLPAAG